MEWTEERVETLKTLWTQGNSASEVSRSLGVTRNAVIGKVHRLGLGRRHAPAPPRTISAQTARRPRGHSGWLGAATRPHAPPRPRPNHAEPSALAAHARPSLDDLRAEALDLPPTADLLNLNVHSCRWPIGHPDQPGFGFCGRDRQGPGAYCDHHRSLAFRRSTLSSSEISRLVGIG